MLAYNVPNVPYVPGIIGYPNVGAVDGSGTVFLRHLTLPAGLSVHERAYRRPLDGPGRGETIVGLSITLITTLSIFGMNVCFLS